MSSLSRRERKADRAAVALAERDEPVSLVASAMNVRVMQSFQGMKFGSTEWQHEGWLHYDNCPEFHAGVNIIANNLSRAKLIGVEIDPLTGDPADTATGDADVTDIMGQLFDGVTGQPAALLALGKHDTVAGDAWMLATDQPDVDGATWSVLGTSEVTSNGRDDIQIERLDGTRRNIDVTRELLMRAWNPHPKRRWEADAATRSLLPVLRELASLTAMVSATVKSRLASAGILWIPDDIVLPKSVNATNDDTRVRSASMGAAGWLDLITEAMTAPIQDPDSAAAVVPLVATVKGDRIKDITHMEFGRDLDHTIEPLREACIRRIAIGLDLPPESLLGMGDVNHWTSWQIDEGFAKTFLAPKLARICDAITRFYLRPALKARGKDPMKFAVHYDLSKLLPRQLIAENAQHAFDAGLLKETVYMEAMGFSATDIADNAERARKLLIELLARGNPQTLAEVAGSIALLFPGINVQPQLVGITTTPAIGPGGTPLAAPTTVTRPAPSVSGTLAPPAKPTPTTNAPPSGA